MPPEGTEPAPGPEGWAVASAPRRRAPALRPDAEPAGPMIPVEAATDVIRRAAELELEGSAGSTAGLDERAIVEIGEEVGLTPAAVAEALAEYRAGLLPGEDDVERPGLVGPRHLVIDRTLPGTLAEVHAGIAGLLERQLLDCCRRTEHRSLWRPRAGLLASVQRAGRKLTRERLLEDLTEVRVTLAALPAAEDRPPSVRVRLEVECQALQRGLTSTAVGSLVVGGGGAVAAAGIALATGDPTPLIGVPILGGAAAGGVLGSRRAYRRKLADVELVLEGALDDLERGRRRR
jgi:hypothetical protein